MTASYICIISVNQLYIFPDYVIMVIMNKAREEVSFPRGSVEVKTQAEKSPTKPSEKVLKRKQEQDLFSNKEKKVEKKKKKVKKGPNEKTSLFDVKIVPTLTYSSMSEGQVLLGFISHILEYELKVSLPGHLVGSVPITNISTDFTNRLRSATEVVEGKEVEADLPSMDSLFKLGDIVTVAVVSVSKSEETNKYSLILSLSPNRTMNGRYFTEFYCAFS